MLYIMFRYSKTKKNKVLSGRPILVRDIVFLSKEQTWVTFTPSLVIFIYLCLALSSLPCSLLVTYNTFCSVNSFLIQCTSCFPIITVYTCVTYPKTYAMTFPQLLQIIQPTTYPRGCSKYVKIHKGSLGLWDPRPSLLYVLGALLGQ